MTMEYSMHSHPRRLAALVALALFAAAGPSMAQLRDLDPDWAELEAPAPPEFNLKRLVPFDLSRSGSELRWGLDPATLRFDGDGVTRYVVVATSASGTSNALFEAINCRRGEVKTYARTWQSGQWNVMSDAEWRGLNSGLPSLHALSLARQALCDANVQRTNLAEIVQLLNKRPTPIGR
jgi:CNP1-like family